MNIDYTALAAWSAVIAALASVVALWSESRQSRYALGIDLLLKLDERFDSGGMRKARRAAAQSMLDKNYAHCDLVLNFFGTVGLLTQRGALDERMVWQTFFYWIHGYWLSAQEYIAQEKQNDATAWSSFAFLHKRLVAIEKKERRISDSELVLTENMTKEFLVGETRL